MYLRFGCVGSELRNYLPLKLITTIFEMLPLFIFLKKRADDLKIPLSTTYDTEEYGAAVRKELMAQVAESGTNFANTSHWCFEKSSDSGPAFSIAEWLTRLMFSYDYIKTSLSSSDKTTLNKWFKNAAAYIQSNYDPTLNTKFVNRNAGNYTLDGYSSMAELVVVVLQKKKRSR